MATLEREFSARWGVDEVFRYFRDGILAGSQSVTDGGGSVYETEGARFIVRVFERFSPTDWDLVSLSLLLADLGDGRIRLTGITAGCGGLEKLWTYGEEAFLKKLTKLADGFDAAHPQQSGRGRPLLAAAGTLLEVISAEPPKIFFDGFGMELPEGAYREYPKCDLLYDLP